MECKVCKGTCQAIPCKSNPEASEWYCEKCHKSYSMTEEQIEFFMQRK